MKFTDFFGIEPIVKPSRRKLLFEGWAKPINLTDGKKCDVHLSLDDVQSVPTKFKIYFTFTIEFKSADIRKKFDQSKSKEDIQTQIQKSMTSKPSLMVSIEPKFVDYKGFYYNAIRPVLSSEQIRMKLNKFAQAGTFNLQDFSVTKVGYPLVKGTLVNDATLWKQYIGKDKKNIKASPIKLEFGYSVEFTASNKLKMYSRTEVMNLTKLFIPEFESSILRDNEYFAFTKNAPTTATLKEQSAFDTPSELFPPTQDTQQPADDEEEDKGPTLKDKKLKGEIASAITFAIGKLGKRELRVGTKIPGIQKLIIIVKHAYQLPPEQEFPSNVVTNPNLTKWFNDHDPIVDGVPLSKDKNSIQISVIDGKEIEKRKKDAAAKERMKGATVPYTGNVF